ncbi:MAG TPA: hypothetical protein VMW73_07130 [Spirochaetia bacterium]|nr:hypothetical protein [Spirochaetia bacterium]
MKPIHATAVLVLLLAGTAATVSAQSLGGKDLQIDISPHVWGVDVGVGVKKWHLVPTLDTIFWIYAGGAWDNKGYFRNPDGSPFDGTNVTGFPQDPSVAPYYDRLILDWKLGVQQGLIDNPALPQDLLSAFMFLQASTSVPLQSQSVKQLLFFSQHSAISGYDVHASLLMGFDANTEVRDPVTKVFSGYYAETSIELAPNALVNFITPGVDYNRLNFTARYFLPIYAAPPRANRNLFSLYAGDQIEADYLWGTSIPLSALQLLGGTQTVDGLGGAIRGLESDRYAANLKVVNNFDLRANLPSLFTPDIVPGVLAFVDAGYFNGLPGAPAGSVTSGFVVSTGAGLSLDFLDLGDLVLYSAFLLHGTLVTGGTWTPVSLALSLQF